MNVDKLPQDIRKKIKANTDKINTLSSTELLEYSRDLYHLKADLGTNVWNYLFECVEVRKNDLNANNK